MSPRIVPSHPLPQAPAASRSVSPLRFSPHGVTGKFLFPGAGSCSGHRRPVPRHGCLSLPAASAGTRTPSERFQLGCFPSPAAAANPKGWKDVTWQLDLPSPPSQAGEDAPGAGRARELQLQREKGGRKVGDRDGDTGAGLTRYRSTRDVFPVGCQGPLWVKVCSRLTPTICVMLLHVQQSFG